jgi:phosphatidylserine/phosphatidylglycerophosphate/cardiolipin synthase-like enzyme
MRITAQANGVSVHAITGTNCVLLAMDAEPAARQGLKGFAIRSGHPASHEGRWLRGFKFFEDLVPDPQPGERRSTLEHPIQTFLWGHYSATPDRAYRYTVRPLYGEPGNLRAGTDVTVDVRTEPNDRGNHAIFFNRGAIPSQKFADLFGNRGPADVNDPTAEDVRWLSRGLLDAALEFIRQARGPRFELRAAVYEFSYLPILDAFSQAAASGAHVRVIYEAGQRKEKGVLKDTSTTVGNREAIQRAGLRGQQNFALIERTRRREIPHNKFIVLLEDGHPIEVWTGSTNFTPSGFLGQANVGHIVRDEAVARAYLAYWNELANDPEPDCLQDWCSAHSPHPRDELPPTGITPIFSPRARSKMLDWYGDRLEAATQTVMLTAAFGVTRRLAERFDNDRDFLRFLLMERRNRSDETQAMLERDIDTRIALGAALNRDAIELGLGGHSLDEWYRREEHFRRRGHVFYVHTKIMLVDVLTHDPLVFTGSANFSPNSLLSNDENMLLIRGDSAVADVYVTEFTRLFNHFYFRHIAQKLAREGRNDPTKAAFLDPTDGWVQRHFAPGSFHSRRRELFRARP